MSTAWTNEKTERLKQMWAGDFSSYQIASSLQMSRGAVLGKLNRLGLLRRRDITKSHPGPRPHNGTSDPVDRGHSMADDEYSLPSFVRSRINVDSLF